MFPFNAFPNFFIPKSLKRDLQSVILRMLSIISFVASSQQEIFSQQSDHPLELIRGRLINARSRQPVTFAHVINKNTRAGVVSDSLGVFKIYAHKNDTLYIRSINYYPLSLSVSDSLVWQLRIPLILLREEVYELAGIDLSGWGTYQEFKFKVLNNITPAKEPDKAKEALRKSIAALPKRPVQENAAIPLGSPVSALYMLFSKEGKSLRRLEAAKERNKIFLLTYQKFNREIVKELTGLKGAALDEFMSFCRPDDEFLLDSNEYDITVRILDDFDRFKKEMKEMKK